MHFSRVFLVARPFRDFFALWDSLFIPRKISCVMLQQHFRKISCLHYCFTKMVRSRGRTDRSAHSRPGGAAQLLGTAQDWTAQRVWFQAPRMDWKNCAECFPDGVWCGAKFYGKNTKEHFISLERLVVFITKNFSCSLAQRADLPHL